MHSPAAAMTGKFTTKNVLETIFHLLICHRRRRSLVLRTSSPILAFAPGGSVADCAPGQACAGIDVPEDLARAVSWTLLVALDAVGNIDEFKTFLWIVRNVISCALVNECPIFSVFVSLPASCVYVPLTVWHAFPFRRSGSEASAGPPRWPGRQRRPGGRSPRCRR